MPAVPNYTSLIAIRNKIKETLEAIRDNSDFLINDFEIENAWMPYRKVESLPVGGLITLVGLSSDTDNKISRTNRATKVLAFQIGYQFAIYKHLLTGL